MLFRWSPRNLPLGGNGRVYIEPVTNETRVYPWGFIRVPRKDVHITSEELQQTRFLLQRQLGPNPEEFFWIISNDHLFQIFTLYPIGWYVQT